MYIRFFIVLVTVLESINELIIYSNYYLLSFICIMILSSLSINKVITIKLDVVISFLLY
jgi:hypothetical protein